jgi:hypothetical protein
VTGYFTLDDARDQRRDTALIPEWSSILWLMTCVQCHRFNGRGWHACRNVAGGVI